MIDVNDGSIKSFAKINEIIEETELERLMRTAQKHPNQRASDDIGIDAYGKIINLDLWSYIIWKDGYALIDPTGSNGDETFYLPLNEDWEQSRLYTPSINKEYVVCPQYIKKAGTNSFIEVKYLNSISVKSDAYLKKLILPSTLKEISMLTNCRGLKSLEIPSSVTYMNDFILDSTDVKKLKVSCNIENRAFSGYNLTSVTFGNECNHVVNYAFNNCDTLYKICFESSSLVTDVYNGEFAFEYNCPVDTVLIKEELYDESKTNISISFNNSNRTFNFKSIVDGYAVYMQGNTSNYNPEDDIEEDLEYDIGNDSIYYPPYDPNYNPYDPNDGQEDGSEDGSEYD